MAAASAATTDGYAASEACSISRVSDDFLRYEKHEYPIATLKVPMALSLTLVIRP